MDINLTDDFVARLQAGAVGSLVAVITDKRAAKVGVYQRLFCGWVVAVFGAPLALSIAMSFDVAKSAIERLNPRDAISIGAFVSGLLGWRIIGFLNKRAEQFAKRAGNE